MVEERTYPFIDSAVVKRLRRKRKEELVAMLCYMTKRAELLDGCIKETIPITLEEPISESFFMRFKEVINKTFGTTLHLIRKYEPFVDGLDSLQVVTFKITEVDSCEECEAEDERTYDPSDVTVQ